MPRWSFWNLNSYQITLHDSELKLQILGIVYNLAHNELSGLTLKKKYPPPPARHHTSFSFFLPRNLNSSQAKIFANRKVSRFILFSPRCPPHSSRELLFFQKHLKHLLYEAFSNHSLLPQAQWNWALNPVYPSVIASETF